MKVRRVEEKEVDVPGLGEKIRIARIAKAQPPARKSLIRLCKEAGVSRNYWYQLEAEEIKGAVLEETLRKIEQVLEVDLGVSFDSEKD